MYNVNGFLDIKRRQKQEVKQLMTKAETDMSVFKMWVVNTCTTQPGIK
jgi:hypothetical protein